MMLLIANCIKGWWFNLSVFTKTVWAQALLVLAPALICFVLVLMQINTNNVSSVANNSLEQCLYMLRSIDTMVRKCESSSNTLATSTVIQELMSKEEQEFTSDNLQIVNSLIRYNAEHYEAINSLKLYSTAVSSVYGRNNFPFWQQERTLYFITPDELAMRKWLPHYNSDGILQGFIYNRIIEYDGQKVGVLEIVYSFTQIQQVLDTLASAFNGVCILYDLNGNIIYGDWKNTGIEREQIPVSLSQEPNGYIRLGDDIVYIVRSEILPFTLAVTHSIAESPMSLNIPTRTAGVSAAIILVCLLLSSGLMYVGITKRLHNLAAHMSTTRTLDNAIPDVHISFDEIGVLARTYNDMLSRVNQLTNKANTAMLLSQKAAYAALQAQIQPHFLYNTIETLRMKAETNGDGELSDLLYAFGRMLRLSISDRNPHGTVSTEFEHIGYYLTLQKLRLADRLAYEIIPPEGALADFSCPRFILQPIIENVILHGFYGQKTAGHLRVWAQEENGCVILYVHDDGIGIEQSKLNRLNASLEALEAVGDGNSIGLSNVHARIVGYYGGTAGLRLESVEGTYTLCIIKLGA